MLSNVSGRWGDDYVFLYPLLQPVEGDELKPWRSSDGAIVVRVYLENVFNSLMDDCLGEAVIPLKELFSNEREGGGKRSCFEKMIRYQILTRLASLPP